MARTPPPPPNRDISPVYKIIPKGAILERVFDPDHYSATADGFRYRGPFARFDHHKKSSKSRGTLYAALNLQGALVEVYGDQGYGYTINRRRARLLVGRDLKLLDLRKNGALRAGTIAQVSSGSHLIARQWSRHFYETPADYVKIEGLIYSNAHNAADAICLYERCSDALAKVLLDIRLDDPAYFDEHKAAAKGANLAIAFYSPP